MTKKPSTKQVKRKELADVEVKPDAWDRFSKTIGKMAPPKPKEQKHEGQK